MTAREVEESGPSRVVLLQFLAADADVGALVRDIIVREPARRPA